MVVGFIEAIVQGRVRHAPYFAGVDAANRVNQFGSPSGIAVVVLMVIVAALAIVLLFMRMSPRSRQQGSLAHDTDGLTLSALRGYALALLDARRFDEAEQVVATRIDRFSGDMRSHALHGALLALRGEHAEALSALERAALLLQRDVPTLPTHLAAYAACLLVAQSVELERLGRAPEAVERMRQAVAVDRTAPTHRDACFNRLIEASRTAEVERLAFERLAEWKEGSAGVRAFGFAEANAALGFYRAAAAQYPQDGRLLGALALAQHATGDHQTAENTFLAAVKIAPSDAWIRYEYGSLLWRRERLPEASAAFAQAAQLAPQAAYINGTHALLLERTGDVAAAEQALVAALSARPDIWVLVEMYASVMASQGKYPQSVRAFREAERLGANDASFRVAFAKVLEQVEQVPESEEQYRLALRTNARSGAASAAYGAFLTAHLRLEDAEPLLLQAVIWPDGKQAHVTLAELYLLERRLTDAQQQLQVAQTVVPHTAELQEYRAALALLRGRPADAQLMAQEIVERFSGQPQRATLHLVLGEALLKLERQMEAQVALREALRRDPRLPIVLLQRARAVHELGYTAAALELVGQALTLAPSWPDALAAQQVLLQANAAPARPHRA